VAVSLVTSPSKGGRARADHAGVRLLPLRYVLALFAVALGCVAVFAASGRSIQRQKRHDSQEAAAVVTATLSSQVTAADSVLEDTAGFISSSRHVARSEFANFAASALRTPAIRWIGFAERMPGSKRAAFERDHGVRITIRGPDNRLIPAPRRHLYFPTVLGAGASGRGPVPVGFDGLGDPLRAAAMREALRTGEPAATPPLRSLRDTWQPFIYVPVFRPNGALQGFVRGALDPHSLVQNSRAAFPGSAGVRVLDGSRVVFSTDGDYTHAERRTLNVAGRSWTVEVASRAAMGPAQDLRWAVALCGMLLLTTLFLLFRRAVRENAHAERLVQERTAELDAALRDADTARAALAERNESLLELDRFKDRMLALISHDLRSPLTSIRGYVELLLDTETGPLDENQERFLNIVKRNADRLDGQIGDLLLLAGIAEGTLQIHRSAVDVARIVLEAVESAAPHAREKGIELEAACRPMRPIHADGTRLAQVLDNLLSNAIKYTPEGGRVDVRAWYEDDWITLTIADTGIGMTRDELDAIFDPFYRTEDAKERGIKGTGLGLVIVKAVVEAHGGGVRVDSEPGGGSRFRITLPAEAPTPWMPPRRLTTLEA
jgi:signal transduction histidine kinase